MAEVAILLATYNGEMYLREQIDSILNQTFQDYTIYIHDDGSTDNTLNIINEYSLSYPDKIVNLEYAKTGGALTNFMSMLKYVSEPYIMFCDQDDYWIQDKIEKTYNEMKRIEKGCEISPCLVFTDLYVVDSSLKIISDSFMNYTDRNPYRTEYTQLLVQNVAPGCTMIINKSLAELMPKYKNADKIQMHDWWAILLAATYGKVSFLNCSTIKYRQHTQNVVGASKKSLIGKIKKCFKQIFNGTYVKTKIMGRNNVISFANELLQVGDLPEEKYEVLSKISQFQSLSKYQRIKECRKYNISTYRRNWWFLFWM